MADDNNGKNQMFNIGGDVSGGNVNVGGNQEFHGDMTFSNTPSNEITREDALQLIRAEIAKVRAELQAAEEENPKAAAKVEMTLENVEETLEMDAPSEERLKITGENLIKAANNLAAVAPIAVSIAKTLLFLK